MSGRTKVAVLVAALAAAAVLSVACGGGKKTAEPPTVTATEVPSAAGAAVDVTLGEWVLEPDPVSVSAGKVTFTVNNGGTKEHEFVIFKTDLAADALPTTADGKVDEEAASVQHIDEIGSILAGKSGELTVDLPPGKYVLICNLAPQVAGATELHYKKGMHAAFTVN